MQTELLNVIEQHKEKLLELLPRGIVSDDNLSYIGDNNLKFISALDKDQIPNIASIDLSIFAEITADNFKHQLSQHGFKRYDDALFFKDLGPINDRCDVLGFNHVLFQEERKVRWENIVAFVNFVHEKNNELKNTFKNLN